MLFVYMLPPALLVYLKLQTPLALLITGLPLIVLSLQKIGQVLGAFLNFNKIEPPACHDPKLLRNATLDSYQQHTEARFTIEAVRDFYFIQRQILKNKGLPVNNAELVEGAMEPRITKAQVLNTQNDHALADTTIKVTASKAKIHYMQQTVRLINKFGFHPTESLKTTLREHREAYQRGKNPIISVKSYLTI